MSQPSAEKLLRLRVRLLCALAGMWGVLTGYAIFILISQRVQEAPGFSAALHFLVVITVAVVVVAITEWFRDTIRGEKSETFRSLSAILTSVLLLAVFEVCVLAYEEVSQATFESPYALKEIAARVSGKEIPYQFFRLSDIPEPRRLLDRLHVGYRDMQANKPSPEGSLIYQLGPEIQWTLFPDDGKKPSRQAVLIAIVQAADPDLSDCARYRSIPFDPYVFANHNPCPDGFEQPQKILPPPQISTADQADYTGLLEKLDVLAGLDDAEMDYFTYASPATIHEYTEVYPHLEPVAEGHRRGEPSGVANVPVEKQSSAPCDADDPNCPLSRMADVCVLSNMTARDLSNARLRALLTVEFNHAVLLPWLYNQSGFQFVDVPEALKESLKQNADDTSSYDNLRRRLAFLRAQLESEAIDDQIEETQDEIARLESRLLPVARLVQLNRQLLVASFPGLLMPAQDQFDERSANLVVLGLLWMLAGGALGWILAEGIFDEQKPGTRASRRGALRGLAAAFVAAPPFVVGYVLLLRLGILIRDVLRFPHELHYLWEPGTDVPRDLLDSTLIPTTIRLSNYWEQKWTTLAIIFITMALLCAFSQIYGRRRGVAAVRRWQWFAVSAVLMTILGVVFDANVPFIYLLVGLVWVTPAVFLGICCPYLRTSSPVPRAWGLVSMLLGIGLISLTILRLWWSAIPLWLCAPGAVLIAVGLVMRAGRRVEEYWPLGALALGLTICGMSALVQRATFLGVLSDVHDLNAYGGYEVKLWPKMSHLGSRPAKNLKLPEVEPFFKPYVPDFSSDDNLGVNGGNNSGSTPQGKASTADPDEAISAPSRGRPSAGYAFGSEDAERPSNTGSTDNNSVGNNPFDWFDDDANFSQRAELGDDFKAWLASLRSEALGVGATGDFGLDSWVMSYQKNDQDRLNRTRDEIARRLELSIVASLGFWLSVGLLAGWAMRSNAKSAEAGLRN